MLDKAINLDEQLRMDFTFAAIDHFKTAHQLAEAIKDEEIIAECNAHIGGIYS